MELFINIFFLLIFAQASLSVLVTLEGGATGIVDKEVALGLPEVALQCSLTSSMIGGTPKLEWLFAKDKDGEGSHLYFDNRVVEWYKDKVFFQVPFSLELRNIMSSDNGYYRCRGVLPGDEPSVDSAKYNLIVLAPPDNQISCRFPSDSAIVVGESAEFHCAEVVQQANPPPVFKWYKDGLELPLTSKNNSLYLNSNFFYNTTDGTLMFEKVVHGDAGEYYCTAENKVGSAECHAVQISTPPDDQISCGFPSGFVITVGESAEFHCAEVVQQANPPPVFKWYKDGLELPLTSKNNSLYLNSNFFYNTTDGTLKFEKVVHYDAGEYYCTAENKVGSAQCHAAQISTPPDDQISCGFPSDSITVGESAEFHCAEVVQQANPPPVFNWYKDSKELPLTSKNNSLYLNSDFSYNTTAGILKFEKVVLDDAGEYYCTAVNMAGSARCAAAEISTSAGIVLTAGAPVFLLVSLLLFHVFF